MTVYRGSVASLPEFPADRAITLGTFDGVHRGHQQVLTELCRASQAMSGPAPCALTFAPHPREVLDPSGGPPLLTSPSEREELLMAAGVELLIVLDFDDTLAAMPYDEFVQAVLIERLHLAHFVLGHDVHFGRGRGGHAVSVSELAAHSGFVVSQVPSLMHEGQPVSSTRIRTLLSAGDLTQANDLLGHPHRLAGVVVEGKKLGRTLGFPTANLDLHPKKLAPALGVYAGWTRVDGRGVWLPSVANLGEGPTVTPGAAPRLEVHLLDQNMDLYGRRLEFAMARRLRPQQRFEGLEELRTAIAADRQAAREALSAVGPASRPERFEDLRADDCRP